jgi:DNA polymerase (family 10)
MTNWNIGCVLLDARDLLLLKREKLLASIYENSAYSVSALEFPLSNSCEIPLFLPQNIREDIQEILNTGNFTLKENLEKEVPKGMQVLLRLPGMHPENIAKLYTMTDIDSVSALSKAVRGGEIRKNREFGLRMEEQLRKSLLLYQNNTRELTLFDGHTYGSSIVALLKTKGVKKIEITGSVRRGKEKVNNINFVVLGDEEKTKEIIKKNLSYKKIEKEADGYIALKDKRNILLKFLIVDEPYFSSAMIYYTGSKMHNLRIKEIGKAKGFECAKRGYLLIQGKGEENIYEKLGMQYIPPEIREGEEEIDLSLRFSLPSLIQEGDIRGDLHVHTNFSDGMNSLREIKEESFFRKYEYVAITDHSSSLKIANGLSSKRLLKQMEFIDRINKERDFPVLLKGSEVEINKNGLLDFGDEILSRLDFVVCAMHSGFDSSAAENTARIIDALSNKFVDVFAHPTGKMVDVRQGYAVNLSKVFEVAAKKGVAMEINLFPKRMDLSSGLVKQARRMGVKYFSVGTDAHNVGHLNMMSYGIKILRRAWLKKGDVVNTFNFKEVKEFLCKKRQ